MLTESRFCCANAEMAHALYHWRYALNQTVREWLARAGHLTPEKIVERDNMHQKKREKATNKIVNEMELTGVMKKLYKEFKENLAAARDSKVFEPYVQFVRQELTDVGIAHAFFSLMLKN